MARKSHPKKRKPLTKEQLLPLPSDKVRALSLEAHIALSVLRRGHGQAMQIGCLAKTLYLAYFMRDVTSSGAEIEQFQVAELIVEDCINRASRGEHWDLPEEGHSAIERILQLYDTQLASVPAHRFADAWQQFLRVVVNNCQTPINGSRVQSPTIGADVVEGLVHESLDLPESRRRNIESQ